MSNTRIIEVEGIGPVYAATLKDKAGITTTEGLLKACKTAKDREALAAKTGLSHKQILEWANRADLFRIKGVGSEYSDLLEAGGVDTVVELGKRNAENLTAQLKTTNDAKKLVRRVPNLTEVTSWVAQAKKMARALEY